MKILISRDEPLTPVKVGSIISKFQTSRLPKLERWHNYYMGKQDILLKTPTDDGKPCYRIVTNFCKSIVDNYAGYLTGKPITYGGDGTEDILEVLRYNDVKMEDTDFLTDALIYGVAFEVVYRDLDGEQRFKTLDPRECIPIYSDDINEDLLYVIRFFRLNEVDGEEFMVEVYGPQECVRYRSANGFATFTPLEVVPNYYDQTPITVFPLNEEQESIFAQVMSLQDAYNTLLSASVEDYDAFADAYLVIKGMTADEDDIKSMKEHRVMMIDADADARYLTKEADGSRADALMSIINDEIYKKCNCPDFSDDRFMAQSGVAIQYKLVGFENAASIIESEMKKALQKRIELINSILNLTGDSVWRDVTIQFTRNLPEDYESIANRVNAFRGLVSDQTLLSQIPFVQDAEEELRRLREEKAAAVYGTVREVEFFGDEEEPEA